MPEIWNLRLCARVERITFEPSKNMIMERIKLTKDQKKALRNIARGVGEFVPEGMTKRSYSNTARELARLDLAKTVYEEGGVLIDAHLTSYGEDYLTFNPSLTNPVDWKFIITSVIGGLTLVGSVVTLFIACTKL